MVFHDGFNKNIILGTQTSDIKSHMHTESSPLKDDI